MGNEFFQKGTHSRGHLYFSYLGLVFYWDTEFFLKCAHTDSRLYTLNAFVAICKKVVDR